MRSNVNGVCPANVSSKRAWSRLRSSQASVSAPLRGLSDQLVAISRAFLPSSGSRLAGGWKIAESTALGTTTGSRSSIPSSRCFSSENSRLEDRRGGELGVELRDLLVRAVVEAAVDADGAVDAVHHPRAASREPLQAREVEVEGVEEAGGRSLGDALLLDLEPAALELAREGSEELVAAARGRRRELVEERQVGASAARAQPVHLVSTRLATVRPVRRAARTMLLGCTTTR